MPFGTVVRDVYANVERRVMYDAIELLTRGNDWHRAGVYCFWDPSTNCALYIGVTGTLQGRFADHNSLGGAKPGPGNKGAEVNAWFESHPRLGFSIILQEALADESSEPWARNAEGQILEGFRRVHGQFPPWNRMGASQIGASFVRENSAWWVDAMTGVRDSPVVARLSIKDLSKDASAEYFENCVHMERTAIGAVDYTNDQRLRLKIDRAIERRAGPPYFDEEIVPRLREYFSRPAPHPENDNGQAPSTEPTSEDH